MACTSSGYGCRTDQYLLHYQIGKSLLSHIDKRDFFIKYVIQILKKCEFLRFFISFLYHTVGEIPGHAILLVRKTHDRNVSFRRDYLSYCPSPLRLGHYFGMEGDL